MLLVVTAWHGDVPVDGDGRRPARLGFRFGGIKRRRKKTEARARPGAFIRRSDDPRHVVGRGDDDSSERKPGTASCWHPCERRG
jgi:hypothetical protein